LPALLTFFNVRYSSNTTLQLRHDLTLIVTMSMITASLWVPRGAAAAFPEKYDVDKDELARISKLAKLQLEDANEDLNNAKGGRQDASETEESDREESGVRLQPSQA